MMLQSLTRFLVLLGCIITHSPSRADEILVVVGQRFTVETITPKQLANIYRRKTMLNQSGERWNPINLSANDPLRIAFAQELFQQPPDVMEAYWNIQYFQGIMPPYAVNSVEAMLRVLDTTPGAIGYVLACHLDLRVKVVLKLSVNASLADSCNH